MRDRTVVKGRPTSWAICFSGHPKPYLRNKMDREEESKERRNSFTGFSTFLF